MEENWWLISVYFAFTLALLHMVFGWWWLLAIPVAILWSWISG